MRSYSRDKNVVLKVCSLFCGLDFVCALSNMRSSNKKCGLNPALPKTCGLKNANISATATATNSIFCTTHHHWPGNLPLQFDPHPLSLLLHTLSNLAKISPFFKILPFRVVHWQIHFFSWPKIPLFQPPELDVY